MEIWAGLNSIHVGIQIARVTSILLNNLKQLLDFIALNVVVNGSRERLLVTPNISEQLTVDKEEAYILLYALGAFFAVTANALTN